MKPVYLVLTFLGAIIPFAVFAPWLVQHGLDLPLLVAEMFATPVAAFFSLDVLVSAVVVLVLAARAVRRGVPFAWLAAVGTCAVGVSFGLPLLLYLEARHAERDRNVR